MGLVTGLALGASALGGALSASSSNKASKRAAQTSADNNAANIALARESRDMSLQRLDPYNNRGNVAGQAINDLLGIGGGPQAATLPGQPTMQYQGNAGSPYGLGDSPGMTARGFGSGVFNNAPALAGNSGINGGFTGTPNTQGGAATASTSPAQAQQSAFDRFRNSTGYNFRLGEGLDAVRSGYGGAGVLQSGAAMRGITEYGQNFASNEFGNYINALGAQQAVGAGAASSAAGVSQNYAANVMNSNNLNAQNQMYAQLGRQNPLANALGTIGGGLFGFGGG